MDEITSNHNHTTPLPHVERIASLDFERGLAIWLMTFLHALTNVYNFSFIEDDPSSIFNLPPLAIVIFITMGIFAISHSYFLLISITVNSFTMVKKISNGSNPEKILLKRVLAGFGLLVVNIIDNSFLYSGYFGRAFRSNDWSRTYPLWNGFFEMGTLRIIGWSIILSSLLIYFLLKKDGHKKYVRNILIIGSLIILIIALSPFVHLGVDSINWELVPTFPPRINLGDNPHWPGLGFQSLTTTPFLAWVLTPFAGDMEPFFPYLATAFIGVLIGLSLAKSKPIKRFPLVGGLTGLGISGFVGIFAALGFFSLSNHRPPIGNYLIMLGIQVCFIFFFLWTVEFRGVAQKFGNNRVVKHFRKWGMISLTIYTLEIFELFPRFIVQSFYNLIFSNDINLMIGGTFSKGEEYKALIFAFIAILFFEFLIFLWSKISFIFSFEWFITTLTKALSKQPTYRLNYHMMMNHIKWIDFKELIRMPQLLDLTN
ncbi:MAG: hypothetical protein JXA54_06120 [Candidatus Heimdallarchaeota archaeon]|nr:hypothetical protein [Candidatus Heimdallarchaeota archaeon]